MKAKELLDHFIAGNILYEIVSVINVDEKYDDIKTRLNLREQHKIPEGEYLVYYNRITNWDGEVIVHPEYTFETKEGYDVYLIKIEG